MKRIIPLVCIAGCFDPIDPPELAPRDPASAESRDPVEHGRRHRPRPPSCGPSSRGRLLSVTDFHHYSPTSLGNYWDSWLVGLAALGWIDDTVDPDIQNGANTFKVAYCTVDFDGTPIVASGMLAFPITFRRSPTVMYSHGTAVTRIDTPSNRDVDDVFDGPSAMVIFAGGGYIWLAPDLTGFGDSSTPRHRYFHADTEGKSSLDMLTAVESFWLYRLRSDGRVFNYGYSQGGHTALAFAREAGASGVRVEATWIGGAVVNVEGWYDFLIQQVGNSYFNVYPTYLLLAYEDVYGDVYGSLTETFQPTFAGTILETYDMNHTYVEVIEALPESHAELVTPDFFASIHEPDAPIRVHLRENSLEDVCLDGPIRWYHMVDDDEVPDDLADESAAVLAGCNDIELIPWTAGDHLNTWHQTLPEARAYFDTF